MNRKLLSLAVLMLTPLSAPVQAQNVVPAADECIARHLPSRVFYAGISDNADRNLGLFFQVSAVVQDAISNQQKFKCTPSVWRNLQSLRNRATHATIETTDGSRTYFYVKDFCQAMSDPCLQ